MKIMENIFERMESEKQSRANENLQNAHKDLHRAHTAIVQQERLRAMGQMASGMAHDINNAVAPIPGYANLLLMMEPDLSEKTRKYLEIIKDAGENITRIVERMRTFYRTEPHDAYLFPFDLNEIAEQALMKPQWEDMSRKKAITIEIKTELTKPLPFVNGMDIEIREALTCLIGTGSVE